MLGDQLTCIGQTKALGAKQGQEVDKPLGTLLRDPRVPGGACGSGPSPRTLLGVTDTQGTEKGTGRNRRLSLRKTTWP